MVFFCIERYHLGRTHAMETKRGQAIRRGWRMYDLFFCHPRNQLLASLHRLQNLQKEVSSRLPGNCGILLLFIFITWSYILLLLFL